MDQPTDGPTDRPSYRDASTHLEINMIDPSVLKLSHPENCGDFLPYLHRPIVETAFEALSAASATVSAATEALHEASH